MNETKKEMVEELKELPKKIFDNELELLKCNNDYDENLENLKLYELKIGLEIAEQKDEDGKKVYSNKEKRDLELKSRLKFDEFYLNYLEKSTELKKELESRRLSVSFMKRSFRAYESMSRLFVN